MRYELVGAQAYAFFESRPRQLQALLRQHPVYLQPAWDLRLIRAIGVAELPLKVALLRHHNCPVQARQHDWKQEQCYQAIDPKCHAQVDTDRRDVERVTRTPKRAISSERCVPNTTMLYTVSWIFLSTVDSTSG